VRPKKLGSDGSATALSVFGISVAVAKHNKQIESDLSILNKEEFLRRIVKMENSSELFSNKDKMKEVEKASLPSLKLRSSSIDSKKAIAVGAPVDFNSSLDKDLHREVFKSIDFCKFDGAVHML
jgi:hypothetical protein